jgi:hypothetical protein
MSSKTERMVETIDSYVASALNRYGQRSLRKSGHQSDQRVAEESRRSSNDHPTGCGGRLHEPTLVTVAIV